MTLKVTETCRDLSELKPSAELACRALFYECAKRGLPVFVTETYRSQARQNYLYEQGRTRLYDDKGKRLYPVTWTRNSNHTPRLAFDIAVCPPHNLYDVKILDAVGTITKELGITWGGSWNGPMDKPHFEVKETWKLPAKYDAKVVKGVIVPSNSKGKVQLTVSEERYANKIGYNITEGAQKYRLVSGPFNNWAVAEQTRYELLNAKYLAYAELVSHNGQWRIQSGAYMTLESSEIAARELIRNNKMAYVSINGTLK